MLVLTAFESIFGEKYVWTRRRKYLYLHANEH